ncbi:hypothetical protein HA41_05530 [Pantoea conspicua]|uniref:DUF5862 domain-containing protein n=1 Tax=Pantoea conspicua TaxID=472705 RepID=A0A1X1BZR6_9GAMM|nr:hypothetical protein [Pantoea conspicua]ORM54449.1 hypothetical protein HA41_05530 [Pantoea conspicua]
MRTLSHEELNSVSGADMAGALFGMMDGAATGMAIGGKWGTGGGWIIGGISQLVGIIVSPIMGGLLGLVVGAATDVDTVRELIADYRTIFGPGNTY